MMVASDYASTYYIIATLYGLGNLFWVGLRLVSWVKHTKPSSHDEASSGNAPRTPAVPNMARTSKTVSAPNITFGLRRVVYDIEIAAKALVMLKKCQRHDASMGELLKIAALIMARNLNDFLFASGKPNDLSSSHYGLIWRPRRRLKNPKTKIRLTQGDRNRISQIAGHIVSKKPLSFSNDTVLSLVLPLVEESVHFVNACRNERKARYHGKAREYVARANVCLKELGLPTLTPM
jgi:hypothetical protein